MQKSRVGDRAVMLPATFAALRHRNFRLFWCGQCVSLIGTWMQTIGQYWLVLQLTDSSFKLGLVGAAQFLPVLLFSLLGGTIADRFPKRNIILLTQSLLLIQAVILAVLTRTGAVRYGHILALALSLGMINSIDMPTRQSFIMEMANREDVMNAIALNSTAFNSARLVGPALAGLVMAKYDAATCFALNALSFLAVILGLYLIRPARREGEATPFGLGFLQREAWREIESGARYVFGHVAIREHLAMLAILSVFAMNLGVLIASFARYTLQGGPAVYGWLMSAMGAGALVGALGLAAFSHRGPKKTVLTAAGLGLCLSELVLSRTRSFVCAASILVVTGLSMTTFNASVNTTLQIAADDQYRGRVMSVYSLVLAGLTPVGSILAGLVTEMAGPPTCIAAGASLGLAGVVVILFLWYRRWRRAVADLAPPAPETAAGHAELNKDVTC